MLSFLACSDGEIDAQPVIGCEAPDHFTSGQPAWVTCWEGNGDDDTNEIEIVVEGRARDGTSFEDHPETGELDAFTRKTEFDISASIAKVQPGQSVRLVAWAEGSDPWTRTIEVLPVEPPGLILVGQHTDNVLEASKLGGGYTLRTEIAVVPTRRSHGVVLFESEGEGAQVTVFLSGDGESFFVEAIDDAGHPWSSELDTNGWGRLVSLGIDFSDGGVDLYVDGHPSGGSEFAMSFRGLEESRPVLTLPAQGALAHFWSRWDSNGPAFGDLNPCTAWQSWNEEKTGSCITGSAYEEHDVIEAGEESFLLDDYGDASLLEGAFAFEVYTPPQ